MPFNDFFSYRLINKDSSTINAAITIDAGHPLYQGHFPGQPVTPGVVLIEIMRQVLGKELEKELMLKTAKEIKFIGAVIPTEIVNFNLTIDYNSNPEGIAANCVFSSGRQVFTKLKGEFGEE